ncbi:hypothetical protein [Actinacidiphila paucisporea]|uniref:Spore coat protein A n=1 Tax=Actinacidiphila paucisporea TaxID=310782 RepID=A0A1M7MN65_9ACTN|nr:hypothetical protein [Actinacidiphila paucisporea]SHM92363.1 spore coat protein A [Actinacidiphila paucisporea]
MSVSRRSVLKLVGGAGLALAAAPSLTGCSATSELNPGELVSRARLPIPFTVPLPVPTPLAPVATSAAGDRYTMAVKTAEVEILPGYRTQIWGYEGIPALTPHIRARTFSKERTKPLR